jgi:hypothetical protein
MADRLPRYRPLGVSLASAPRIDYAGAGAAEARGYQQMSQALDRISAYAFEEAGKRAAREGEEFGYKLGENPEQIKAALEAGTSIDDIVGDPDTVFGAASRAAVGLQLKAELEGEVRSKLAQLTAAIEGGDILDPADVEVEIDSITEGHASLLSQLGGKYARDYRATVGVIAAPVYKAALEQSYKLRNAAISAQFRGGLESTKPIIYGIYNDDQGATITIDGETVLSSDAAFDVFSKSLIDQAINTRNAANVTAAQEFLKDMRENAKVNALRKYARENPDSVNETAGLFGNKTALYAGLDEDAKERVRDEIRDERSAIYLDREHRAGGAKESNTIRALEIAARIAILRRAGDPNNVTLLALQEEYKALYLSGRANISENDYEAATSPVYRKPVKSNMLAFEEAKEMIQRESLRDIDSVVAYMDANNIYQKERTELITFFEQQHRADLNAVTERLKLARGEVGVQDATTDTGIYIREALPKIIEMNEAANLERAEKGERPETLVETTERYINDKVGDIKIDNIKRRREAIEKEFGKYVDFNFENATAGELEILLNNSDILSGLPKQMRDPFKRKINGLIQELR